MAKPLPFYVREDDAPAKRQILVAAMTLFADRGLDGTSIRDIARESGYTNPALYKHFASKEQLAVHLFETCHQRLWTKCHAAITAGVDFEDKLDKYIGQVLELVDQHPQPMSFLSEHARVLWPKAGSAVRRRTMIGLARSLMGTAARSSRSGRRIQDDIAAASLQGTLAELTRMLQVGVIPGPAIRWKSELVALFGKIAA
jgi:AcrR family transcriptional regulator